MKIRTAQGDFVEFETEDERRAAILDLIEGRTNVEDKYLKPAQELNQEEFNKFLNKYIIPDEVIEEQEILPTEPPKPKRKIKDVPQA